jgi:integrase
LAPSWHYRRTIACDDCLAAPKLASLLAPDVLRERVPQPWARELLERYARALAARGYSLDGQHRRVQRAIALCSRMGIELFGVETVSWEWLREALAGESRDGILPIFSRFLQDEGVLPDPSEEERWLQRIATGLSRVPSDFFGPMERYTEFRLEVHRQQREQRLAHVLKLRTIDCDVSGLTRFARYLRRMFPAVTGWHLVAEQHVVEYLRSLNVHPNSRNAVRWDLHSFFAYCLRHRLVAHNPVPGEPGREAPSAIQPLTPDEQSGLLQRWVRMDDPIESLVGLLALLHGLTSDELVRLRLADVDAETGRIRVPGRAAPVVLDRLTRHGLSVYLAWRAAVPALRDHPFLLVNGTSRFTRERVSRRYLGELMRRGGVTPTQLRLTCFSTVAQESGPRLLVDGFGLSPTQAGRYQGWLAYRADQALMEHAQEP